MGLTALMLLQHARSGARFDARGEIILLEDQDRGLWDGKLIAEGLALIDKAMRHRQPGPYQIQAAIAALHARAARAAGHRLGADRRALCRTRTRAAFARRDAQSRGRGEQGSGTGGGAGDDRAARSHGCRLFPLLRHQRRAAPATRPRRRRRAWPSTMRSRSRTPPPRPRISASIWTGSNARARGQAGDGYFRARSARNELSPPKRVIPAQAQGCPGKIKHIAIPVGRERIGALVWTD